MVEIIIRNVAPEIDLYDKIHGLVKSSGNQRIEMFMGNDKDYPSRRAIHIKIPDKEVVVIDADSLS